MNELFSDKVSNLTFYLCGGSLISRNYVLTAAHCLSIDGDLELATVRLGGINIQEKGCDSVPDTKNCSNKIIDVPVESLVPHPFFNSTNLKNDLALVKLERDVPFSENIRPICLPFGQNSIKNGDADQQLIVSGWGKTDSRKFSGSITLQYATVTVWKQQKCEKVVPPEVSPLTETQLCANGKSEDACKGDSGGPLFKTAIDEFSQEVRAFQVGVVSFAPAATCGIQELPTVYTRVDKFINWISENVE